MKLSQLSVILKEEVKPLILGKIKFQRKFKWSLHIFYCCKDRLVMTRCVISTCITIGMQLQLIRRAAVISPGRKFSPHTPV